jgi:hypothetical protein
MLMGMVCVAIGIVKYFGLLLGGAILLTAAITIELL